ncbi:MAG: hypothetical protein Q8P41_12465 [Pseudomonadota bacterium]|nr:hypothetical protein [Pseudomonadota bacterium]
MFLGLLAGCAVHLGVLPIAGSWSVGEVSALVAEPDADAWVREATVTALVARGALDPSAPAVDVVVTEAAWMPARRAGDVLLYDARLTLRFTAGDRVATRTRTWSAVDPGNAADARVLREDTLRMLAREAADDAIGWLLAP